MLSILSQASRGQADPRETACTRGMAVWHSIVMQATQLSQAITCHAGSGDAFLWSLVWKLSSGPLSGSFPLVPCLEAFLWSLVHVKLVCACFSVSACGTSAS